MPEKTPGLIELILFWGGTGLAWLTGEGGRIAVASGLGGLTRWLVSERQRIRDGVIAIFGGLIVGQYLWPLVLHVPGWVGGAEIPETPNSIAMAAFVAGTMGMSAVKIIIAIVETRSAKLTQGGGGHGDA